MSKEINALYDQSLEYLTRVSSCVCWNGGSSGGFVEGEIDHMGEILLKRDLLIFAASMRNLTEACANVRELKSINLRLSTMNHTIVGDMLSDSISINFYQAFSRILHSIETDVFFRINPLRHMRSSDQFLNYQILSSYGKKCYPDGTVVIVNTEKETTTTFYLKRLVMASSIYLHKALEDPRLSEKFSERYLRDM